MKNTAAIAKHRIENIVVNPDFSKMKIPNWFCDPKFAEPVSDKRNYRVIAIELYDALEDLLTDMDMQVGDKEDSLATARNVIEKYETTLS